MLWVYRLLGILAALVGIPYLLIFRRGEIRERLGGSHDPRPGSIWIHAASLGEFEAAEPIIRAWSKTGATAPILVSCTNRIARQRLVERLPNGARARLAPLDLAPCLYRALRQERPSCLLLVETEIWPEWITIARRMQIPVAVVSARISDRTYPRYRRLRPLLRPLLSGLHAVGCRSEEDRRRWIDIGAPRERCFVWGNTKYEIGVARPGRVHNVSGEIFVLIAGSVRTGEEQILDLVAMIGLDRIRLIVAPRHLRTLWQWERACLRRRLPFRRFSACGLDPSQEDGRLGRALRSRDSGLPPILLVDRMGVLRMLYRNADAAFVGGTWAPIGGHNLFEAAREGIPVFFGESIAEVRDVAAALLETGGGARVADVAVLAAEVERLLGSPRTRSGMGEAARVAAERLAGAVQRTLNGLRELGIPPGTGS